MTWTDEDDAYTGREWIWLSEWIYPETLAERLFRWLT